MPKEKIKLGDKVKDPISGVTGIAVAITKWLYGCNRVAVQPKGVSKDTGKPFKISEFDEPQLEIISSKKIKRASNDTGGPRPSVLEKPTTIKV